MPDKKDIHIYVSSTDYMCKYTYRGVGGDGGNKE